MGLEMNQPENELQSRIDALHKEADRVSEQIKQAESLLQQIPTTQDVKFAYLKWDHKNKRIISLSFEGERPLIECPLKERICRQLEINSLVDAVLMETESFMEKHRSVT